MAAIAGAVAATAAGLTYLDGKYHIRQDVTDIRARRRGRKLVEKAIKEKRMSPWYLFEAEARAHPDADCIWSRSQGCYTYGEALARATQYGHFFATARGVRPGDLVALFMANSPDFVLAWLGLLAVGAAPALINHNLARQALLHCLGVAGAALVLADGPDPLMARLDGVADELAQRGVRVARLRDDADNVRAELDAQATDPPPPDALREGVRPDSPYGLFYTSGTTGLPKAVAVPVLAAYLGGVGGSGGTGPTASPGRRRPGGERFYDCMPLYHGTGGMTGTMQLLAGQTLCLAPRFSASGFWDDVRACRATWFVYVGETLRYLLAAPPSPSRDKDHGVRAIYGNGLRPDVWRAFRDRFGIETIHEFFNSTEGALPLDNHARGDFRAHAVGHHGALTRWWRLRGHLAAAEVDPDTGELARNGRFVRRLPLDVGGEILVRAPPPPGTTPPFPGYHGNASATAARYARDVFAAGDCWYRTGDALRRDAEGRWYFLDRLGDSFRWKGENVSTAEVSEVLGRFPGVGEATVYGVALPGHDGKAGMAAIYVDPAAAGSFDYAGLLRHARTHLPRYAVPLFVRRLAARSSMHNNKQDKAPLRRAGVDPAQTAPDPVLWVDGLGKGDAYAPFTAQDWDAINAGRAKL
ncbi:hypothetical protein GGR56DRAFT_391114 [Xylariaceae sp. FL0804]|nr:hypothetical protein GGR56DRAFT_391114 [Xylariaceae sp. FL0804]